MNLLLENVDSDTLKKYMDEFYSYASDKLKLDRKPKVFFVKNVKNANDMFGKTGYYNPQEETVHIYVTNRHAKDILRSFAHELVHHMQKCKGMDTDINLSLTSKDPAYASHDPKLREMERQAFELGNMIFRDWCDMKKIERKETMSETKKITNEKVDVPASREPEFRRKRHKISLAMKKRGGLEGAENPEAVTTAAALKQMGLANEELDQVGQEDDDINNDGTVDKTDKYLKRRRDAISRDIKSSSRKNEYLDSNVGEFGEKLNESHDKNPYPELFKKKERLFQERFSEYEQLVFSELMKRIIKKEEK